MKVKVLGWLLTVTASFQGLQLRSQAPPVSNELIFDARKPISAPEAGFLHMGGRSPDGHEIAVNSRYLSLDGHPWLPVMGEFHFSRVSPDRWEDEILKMKAGGIQIVSTYVFWIHHEEIEGEFDWSGQRDLRKFVRICQKHGMYVYLRIGPWVHGEARNGGFPDWLLVKTKNVRRNDPTYLHYVEIFDRQIALQVRGLLWQDGGPVIGVQLENEYGALGPGAGSEHLQKLKDLAVEAGLVTPLYSATAWPNYRFPEHEMIPMAGGYPDGFWPNLLTDSPPKDVYKFEFNRLIDDMGAMDHASGSGGAADPHHYPYATAESGAGMETAYHRRPWIRPEDIAALTITGLGSGVNWYGYFMFQGGANPDGKLTSLQESQESGYPNDLPRVSYDFQAPLGQYGQVRKFYFELKAINLFLDEFGSYLAPMVSLPPSVVPRNAADLSVSRAALRMLDGHGFLFVNNYVRQSSMPERKNFQAVIYLKSGELRVPLKPLDVPANRYFIWPINLQVGGSNLSYATTQLMTRVSRPGTETYFFFAVPNISAELAFGPDVSVDIDSAVGTVEKEAGFNVVRIPHPGQSAEFYVKAKDNKRTRVVVLNEMEAEHLWTFEADGSPQVALSDAIVLPDDDRHVNLETTGSNLMKLAVFTPDKVPVRLQHQDGSSVKPVREGDWTMYTDAVPAIHPAFLLTKLKDPGAAPAAQMGKSRKPPVVTIPSDAEFSKAGEWRVSFPKLNLDAVNDVYLKIDYLGDVGRAYVNDRLVDDNFYNGTSWVIGLRDILSSSADSSLKLQVLPLARGTPIYLDRAAWAKIPASGQIATIESIAVEPEYKTILSVK